MEEKFIKIKNSQDKELLKIEKEILNDFNIENFKEYLYDSLNIISKGKKILISVIDMDNDYITISEETFNDCIKNIRTYNNEIFIKINEEEKVEKVEKNEKEEKEEKVEKEEKEEKEEKIEKVEKESKSILNSFTLSMKIPKEKIKKVIYFFHFHSNFNF